MANLSTTPVVNVSAAWAGSTDGTATSNIPVNLENPSIECGSGVLEACVKEALVCEVSPLVFHLTLNIKEKIRKHEFIALLSLIPSTKDVAKSETKSERDKDDERK